jgi:L-threonate 2-dehydrogenase
VLGGALTAASALKMSYAGVTKGTQALAAVMLLAATRAGSADALFIELSESQAPMLAWLKRSLALMPPKANRWVAEMHEIARFVVDDPAGQQIYGGAAHFYEQIARDFQGEKIEVFAFEAFFNKTLPTCTTICGGLLTAYQ